MYNLSKSKMSLHSCYLLIHMALGSKNEIQEKKFLSPYFSKNMYKAVQNCKTFMCEFYILRLPKSCLKLWYVAERLLNSHGRKKILWKKFNCISFCFQVCCQVLTLSTTSTITNWKFKITSRTTKNKKK